MAEKISVSGAVVVVVGGTVVVVGGTVVVVGGMADKLASGLSARSVQYIHAVLRVALNNAVRMGIIGRNVATLTDPPRVTKKEIQPLEPADARRFLTTCANDRLHALYSVAISMGLRQAEILGLRWRNLDLDNANLHVTHQLQRIGGQWQFTEPKSDRSRRTLTIPQTCVTALRAHKVGQATERLAAGPEWDDQDLVFTTHTGRPIDPANQLRHFKRICHDIGLGDRRFHDLRHTCATLLLIEGVPLRVVADILGHSQITLTADTYQHVIPQLLGDAASAMDSALSG